MFDKEKSDENRSTIIKAIKKDNVRFALKCAGAAVLWTVAIKMLADSNDNTYED